MLGPQFSSCVRSCQRNEVFRHCQRARPELASTRYIVTITLHKRSNTGS